MYIQLNQAEFHPLFLPAGHLPQAASGLVQRRLMALDDAAERALFA
ncbi:hypothetical protein [Pseudomonas cavernae]|nr:hypothetical protein [Pseudomonas cavernae]